MGKYEKPKSAPQKKKKSQHQKRGSHKALPWVLVILIAVVIFGLFFMPGLLYRLRGGSEETQPPQTTGRTTAQSDPGETTFPAQAESTLQLGTTTPTQPPETTSPAAPSVTAAPTEPPKVTGSAVSLPLALEGGLQLESLFQFSGINPDAANQEGADIAAILLKNTSGSYLLKADLTVTLTDGQKLTFAVADLPAGKSAMAFSLENATIGADAACSAASCDATFDAALVPIPPQVTASANGMTVTLTNNSDKALTNLVVYCRSPLDEEYFGGIAYKYTVNSLPPHGTVTVDAVDCILGIAEVVRVDINNE